MSNETRPIEDLLLDFHLDQLSETEAAALRARIETDPQVRAKSERLGRALQPLDLAQTPLPPKDLSDMVLRHIRSHGDSEHTRTTALPPPTPQESGRASRPLLSFRELLAAAACIALLVSVMVPGIASVRQYAKRAACRGNLESVFRSTMEYQNDFGGALPFAGALPGASWLPVEEDATPFASNSRHIYLLLKHGYADDPRIFVCPSCAVAEPVDGNADKLRRCNDFRCSGSISYALLNMAGRTPQRRLTVPLAYVSDANPLFRDGRFRADINPDTANATAHGGAGQNVLRLDGSVEWMTTPIDGPRRDNIWLVDNVTRYTGTEVQESPDDAFLVPGFPRPPEDRD